MTTKLRLSPYPQRVELADGAVDLRKIKLIGEACPQTEFFRKLNSGWTPSDDGVPVKYKLSDIDCPADGYILKIGDEVEIAAKDNGGLLYGFVTLAQLIAAYGGEVPAAVITDYPKTAYRGLLLDVCRYFFTKEEVLRFIDFCAIHKLNALHWHLTEDQGWRIEIEKYPLLTEKGSMRSHTNFNSRPHGGYYTKRDIKEIVAYANALNIEVIPEFDVPGHTRSALAAYPYLGCFGRELPVATHTGVKHDVLCAGKDTTYEFVYGVLDELFELFGGQTKFVHLGGDEVFKQRWSLCPDCQRVKKDNNLPDEDALESYFLNKVCDYVVSKGFTPIMWRESAQLKREDVYYEFYHDDGSEKCRAEYDNILRENGGVINCSSRHCYVDLPYHDINLRQSYGYEPLLKDAEGKFRGGEIALWTEYVPDFKTACVRLLPRSVALSERLWTEGEGDYEEFLPRMNYTLKFLKSNGYKSAPLRKAMPNKLRALCQKLWFERRQLHWEGLHNLIDDASVARNYGKK